MMPHPHMLAEDHNLSLMAMVPISIGPWLRGSLLGSGSFGSVSLALNLVDGFLFAVKSTPLSPSCQLSALQNELHILQTLDSPRIVRCLGAALSSSYDDSPCLNMFLEYMELGSIGDSIKKSGGSLDEVQVRAYTRGILEGLCYLHKQGIVHSDIKAHNILLGSSGEIKIADFGSARSLASIPHAEGLHMRGTPLWMAPEVIQGVEQGTPSDIWSLGCTVVEMLQGRPPWAHGSSTEVHTPDVAAILYKIAYTKENPQLPAEHLLSADAHDFLSKCLQRDPGHRWTAEQLLEHPFVAGAKDRLGYTCQASPRSTLDYFSNREEDESDCEDESNMVLCRTSLPCVEAAAVADGQLLVRNDHLKDMTWITLRCTEGWSDQRHKPFFRTGGELVHVRKGCQITLHSADFLSRRGRTAS